MYTIIFQWKSIILISYKLADTRTGFSKVSKIRNSRVAARALIVPLRVINYAITTRDI